MILGTVWAGPGKPFTSQVIAVLQCSGPSDGIASVVLSLIWFTPLTSRDHVQGIKASWLVCIIYIGMC